MNKTLKALTVCALGSAVSTVAGPAVPSTSTGLMCRPA
jgi:hypothetical protein